MHEFYFELFIRVVQTHDCPWQCSEAEQGRERKRSVCGGNLQGRDLNPLDGPDHLSGSDESRYRGFLQMSTHFPGRTRCIWS